MPVYLFTYHAYGSWLPDHPRGFVDKRRGAQASNRSLGDAYRQAARHKSFEFDRLTQYHLISKARAVCAGDGFRLHGAATEPTHLHALVSWIDETIGYVKVRRRLKNLLSLDLSRRAGVTGRPWFSTGSSRRQIKDEGHFRHLLDMLPAKAWRRGVVRRTWVGESAGRDGGRLRLHGIEPGGLRRGLNSPKRKLGVRAAAAHRGNSCLRTLRPVDTPAELS